MKDGQHVDGVRILDEFVDDPISTVQHLSNFALRDVK